MNQPYTPRIITPESLPSRGTTQHYVEPVSNETDEEIIERTRMKFQILEDMTKAVKKGDVRAIIISGPPGIGKSFGVEKVLGKHDMFSSLTGEKKYEIIKGNMSALMLYRKLWDYKDAGCVIVLDDCDHVLMDEIALNILKTALDSNSRRTISWNTDSRYLKDEGIPNSFDFEGGMIFATNIKFSTVRSKKLKDHLDALESRCHYLDLAIDTEREKMLRIKQIVNDGMLDKFEMPQEEVDEILEYLNEHKRWMREISLRSVLKICELKKSMPHTWQQVGKMTLMVKH